MVLGKKLWGLLGLELSGELKNVVQMTVSLKLTVLENLFSKGNIGKKKFFGHLISWVILNKTCSMQNYVSLKLTDRPLPEFLVQNRPKMVLGKKPWCLLGLELSGELKNVVQMTVSLKLTVLENLFPKRNIGAKFPFHHLIPWVLHNHPGQEILAGKSIYGRFHGYISPFSLI